MRIVITILILAVLVLLAAVATGYIDINQTRGVQTPEIEATGNGVVARGGQTPAFEVETGSVRVGAKETQVKVPQVEVVPPADNQAAAPANAQ